MEKDNQKTKRPYNNSLGKVFMTTKEIAELWSRKVVDKDGKERFLVPRKRDKTQNKQWEASDISRLFKSILEEWGLKEYINRYRCDKAFYLKENLGEFERYLELMSESVQMDIESFLKKRC